MTHAIVLIQAESSALPTLGGELADIEGVAEAYSVTGEWDFVAILRLREQDQLAQVVTGKLSQLAGVRRTQTMVAFEVYSRHDLEALFSVGPLGRRRRGFVGGPRTRHRPPARHRERALERGCHRVVGVGGGRLAGGGAEPLAQRLDHRAGASIAAASATESPGRDHQPGLPSRTRPPATAPTALVATTGRPWCIASLQTSPHGSRKRGVGIDGSSAIAAAR